MDSNNCNKFNVNEVLLEIETLQTDIEDVGFVVQLLEVTMAESEVGEYLVRSVAVIDKMLKIIKENEIGRLKNLILHNQTE